MFLAYVKETLGKTPTLECLKSEDMIQGFVQTLVQKRIQGSTIAQYVDHLLYGLRYLYSKERNKNYREMDLYVALGRMREKFRKQTVHSTAHQSWQALAAKKKWTEWSVSVKEK